MSPPNQQQRPNPVPSIRQLKIKRFRGIEQLQWLPAPGLNVIVGPGDTCKSTILEAIGALLSPATNINVSEFDYFLRKIDRGFEIEAVLAIGDNTSILKSDRFPLPPLRGWRNGQLTDLPDEGAAEPVMVCRLTGSPDQEAIYEVIGADEDTRVSFSRALRQHISLLRLGIADRWDRDLRLVQGGALDRFMEGQHLRQSILQAILSTSIHDRLGKDPKEALDRITSQFSDRSLPNPVRLGLVGTPGVSLAASVGLMIGENDENALPLPAWGTGTRRLATLELVSLLAKTASLAVVDEPESGLEPYRQRAFIGDLNRNGMRQAFITTHSPAILSASAALGGMIWRIRVTPPQPADGAAQSLEEDDPNSPAPHVHELVELNGKEIAELLKGQPEAVLARLSVICEGITEVGFATRLLIRQFGEGFSVRGLFCVNGQGHDQAVAICKALLKAGFQIGAVVDDEGRKDGSWNEIGKRAAVLRWDNGAVLEHAVLRRLPDHVLPSVVGWPEEFGGRPARHCLPELRTALGADDKAQTAEQLLATYGREAFLNALCVAACPPRDGKHKPTGWFKSFDGGFLLADKLLALETVPKELNDKIVAFLTAVERATA